MDVATEQKKACSSYTKWVRTMVRQSFKVKFVAQQHYHVDLSFAWYTPFAVEYKETLTMKTGSLSAKYQIRGVADSQGTL